MKKKFIIETGEIDSNGNRISIDGLLKANAEFTGKNIDDGYPAIGFTITSSKRNEHGGRDITEIKLLSIGISSSPNVDRSIKRLSEQ